MKNLATHIPERLTVYEFLTELNNEQLSELEEMIKEVWDSRIKKVRVKMEVRRTVEEIYWIDEEIEIPDYEEDAEEYIREGIAIESFDISNSQITVLEEAKKVESIEEV